MLNVIIFIQNINNVTRYNQTHQIPVNSINYKSEYN